MMEDTEGFSLSICRGSTLIKVELIDSSQIKWNMDKEQWRTLVLKTHCAGRYELRWQCCFIMTAVAVLQFDGTFTEHGIAWHDLIGHDEMEWGAGGESCTALTQTRHAGNTREGDERTLAWGHVFQSLRVEKDKNNHYGGIRGTIFIDHSLEKIL